MNKNATEVLYFVILLVLIAWTMVVLRVVLKYEFTDPTRAAHAVKYLGVFLTALSVALLAWALLAKNAEFARRGLVIAVAAVLCWVAHHEARKGNLRASVKFLFVLENVHVFEATFVGVTEIFLKSGIKNQAPPREDHRMADTIF